MWLGLGLGMGLGLGLGSAYLVGLQVSIGLASGLPEQRG